MAGGGKAADALGDAFYQHCLSGKKFTEEDTIREAGGAIIEVHNIREDGKVRSEDLPDWRTD